MGQETDWIMLFDAVGTLIRPQPDVNFVYLETARQFGSRLNLQEISDRFQIARRRYFEPTGPVISLLPGSLISSNQLEYENWKRLVQDVLCDVGPIDAAFEKLWDHFGAPQNWQVYPDVEPCWRRLTDIGLQIGIASNFDQRLEAIVAELAPLSNCQHLFYSSDLGFRKPDPGFYQTIENTFETSGSASTTGFVMIGDQLENDYHAPQRAGWRSYWLNRTDHPQPEGVRTIRSLPEILKHMRDC